MLTKQFITAGRAVFTLEVPGAEQTRLGCQPHYTFRVRKARKQTTQELDAWFVQLLTGPDNTSDYTYVGLLTAAGQLRLTAKSQFADGTVPVKFFRRLAVLAWAGDLSPVEQAGYKLHHEGRCGRCGRTLTVPSSVESGIGPECATKLGGE